MASDGAEVAEDYRLALEDLSSNMRHEISNLTVIARENTEHALAIAEVLQQHIIKASPNRKLPALYVLDSIVKNVGTPYTLYFGRNLFKTFMESYAVVDHVIRRKMEEMLKTWKDPVAGSMDTRPPFSAELVRPIENALMKVRTAAMQQQGHMPGRPRSAMVPHRDTPTPPGMRGPGGPPGSYQQQHYPPNGRPGEQVPGHAPYPGHPQQPYYSQHLTPQPAAAPFQPPVPGPYGQAGIAAPAGIPAGISVENLSNDIQNLIVAMKAEFSQNPHDTSVHTRLKALLDLQAVVQSTSLPPDQLDLIKHRVNELAAAVTLRAPSAQNQSPYPVPPVPQPQPPQHQLPQVQVRPASVTPTPGPAAQPPVTLDALLGQGALAALMGRQSATPQNATPKPPAYTNVAIRSPPPTHAETPKPAAPANPLSLLDQLRQAGMLPPTPTGGAAAPPPSSGLPPSISSLLASRIQPVVANPVDPGLQPAALKQKFRPEIVSSLYDELGPACTQCGRRFRTDAIGRQKKMAHMDWHFRVHQRSTEAEKRGTHRSWYVDQQDWLKSRESVDADHIAASEEAAAAQASRAAEAAKPKYIPVPDAHSGINTVCPICQERFENKWLDTAQEWVWLDAVLVGNRAYHASCHAEATRDREGTPGAGAGAVGMRKTPEPVLGKRKAETSIASPKIRSLKTSA